MSKNNKRKYYNKQTNSYYYKKDKNNKNKSSVINKTVDDFVVNQYTLSGKEAKEIKELIDLEIKKDNEELDNYIDEHKEEFIDDEEVLDENDNIEKLEAKVKELEKLVEEKENHDKRLDLELDEQINTEALSSNKSVKEVINDEINSLKNIFKKKDNRAEIEVLDTPVLKDRSDEIETLDIDNIENKVNQELFEDEILDDLESTKVLKKINKNIETQEKIDNLELTHVLEKVNKNIEKEEKMENLELTHVLEKVNKNIEKKEKIDNLELTHMLEKVNKNVNDEIEELDLNPENISDKQKNIELENLEENKVRDNIINRLDNIENIDKNKYSAFEITIIILTIIMTLGSIIVFGFRAYYYYTKEHTVVDNTLYNSIVNINNIVYTGDGLYKDSDNENNYYYKGTSVNNYVIYKGITWRILNINDKVNLIMDETLTTLSFGKSENYKDSIINEYLNNYIKTIDSDELYENSYCDSNVDVNNYDCINKINLKVGLLSTEEYLKYGGKSSYLNNESYFYTINYDSENNKYFINKDGSINNVSSKDDNYFAYGIRPVISISKDLKIESGDGTVDTPYIIERTDINSLNDSLIGNYVNYKDKSFRIINKDNEGITLLSNDLLDEMVFNNVYSYLNTELIKEFNKEDLIKQDYYLDEYNLDNNYDYKLNKNKYSNYIIIPSLGDYFINDESNYFINNLYNSELIYTISDNNTIFSDLKTSSYNVRYIIKVKNTLNINNGQGTMEDPYIIGEVNE